LRTYVVFRKKKHIFGTSIFVSGFVIRFAALAFGRKKQNFLAKKKGTNFFVDLDGPPQLGAIWNNRCKIFFLKKKSIFLSGMEHNYEKNVTTTSAMVSSIKESKFCVTSKKNGEYKENDFFFSFE